jgi:hypothetical protein
MGRNAIQFQKGLSVPEFQALYGTEAQCEDALAQMRWPQGFRCPRCEGAAHGLVYGRRLRRYQYPVILSLDYASTPCCTPSCRLSCNVEMLVFAWPIR